MASNVDMTFEARIQLERAMSRLAYPPAFLVCFQEDNGADWTNAEPVSVNGCWSTKEAALADREA